MILFCYLLHGQHVRAIGCTIATLLVSSKYKYPLLNLRISDRSAYTVKDKFDVILKAIKSER